MFASSRRHLRYGVLSAMICVPVLALESRLSGELDSQFGKIPSTVPMGLAQTDINTPHSSLSNYQLPHHVDDAKSFVYVYTGKRTSGSHYIPSGWMGDYGDIQLSDSYMNTPSDSKTCLKVTYTGNRTQGNGWAGIYWQNPGNNWGGVPGGYDLRGMHRLTFWARGARGGEKISSFKIGGIQGFYSDSDSAQIGPIVLTPEWRQYTIDLASVDLSRIIGGFAWSAGSKDGPMTFYLDQIRYER